LGTIGLPNKLPHGPYSAVQGNGRSVSFLLWARTDDSASIGPTLERA